MRASQAELADHPDRPTRDILAGHIIPPTGRPTHRHPLSDTIPTGKVTCS